MPSPDNDAEAKMRKLGEYVQRDATRRQAASSTPQKSMETARNAVRAKWQKQRAQSHPNPSAPNPEKSAGQERDEPEIE